MSYKVSKKDICTSWDGAGIVFMDEDCEVIATVDWSVPLTDEMQDSLENAAAQLIYHGMKLCRIQALGS